MEASTGFAVHEPTLEFISDLKRRQSHAQNRLGLRARFVVPTFLGMSCSHQHSTQKIIYGQRQFRLRLGVNRVSANLVSAESQGFTPV